MPLFQLIFVLVVVGVALYLINKYVPMAESIKTILNWSVIVGCILWVLSIFGFFTGWGNIHIGR